MFVVDTTGGAEALEITTALRRVGIRVDRAYESRSMKSQMKVADRSGAAIALIVGSDELEQGVVTLRPLRGEDRQYPVPRAELIESVEKALT